MSLESICFCSRSHPTRWLPFVVVVAMTSAVPSALPIDPGTGHATEQELAQYEANVANRVKGSDEVILVRVYDEHSQLADDHRHGALPYLRFDWKGTVLQSVKGDWKVGETISFFLVLKEGVSSGLFKNDTRMQTKALTSYIGQLKYLFMDKSAKDKPNLLETGAELPYSPELEAILTKLQPTSPDTSR